MREELSGRVSRTVAAGNRTSAHEETEEKKVPKHKQTSVSYSTESARKKEHPNSPQRFRILTAARLRLWLVRTRTPRQAAMRRIVAGDVAGTVTARRRALELLRMDLVAFVVMMRCGRRWRTMGQKAGTWLYTRGEIPNPVSTTVKPCAEMDRTPYIIITPFG